MESEKLKRIEEIYHAALEVSPSEREAFLDESCGTDDNLRREVESLLSFEDSDDNFLNAIPESFVAKMFAAENNKVALIGTEISHYKIIKLLGKGGMGEVYLAEDTKLDRKVALKILPPEFSPNNDRIRSRFVREAKSASALNHPNIAHIYEIGEAKGINFIAMEFIEGSSLREKIHSERTDLRILLKYLTQVADGLAKAHQSGIVHRDLKPDNLMISADGFAKILDFGLAKLVRSKEFGSDEKEGSNLEASSLLPTPHSLLPTLTNPGVIMGTVGYMSPEQARGESNIDARSDIFSFGCILFEAATKQQPFAAETMVDSLHKIIHSQPPPLKNFNATVPADLQRIVRRCLAKDPEDRYQNIKDAAIELKELRREIENTVEIEPFNSLETSVRTRLSQIGEPIVTVDNKSAVPTNESVIHSASSAEYLVSEAKKHKIGAGVVVALLALVAIGIGYGVYSLTTKQNVSTLTFQTAKFTRLTTTGKASGVAISPDGKYVVHIQDEGGQQSLWTRQVATQSNVQIVAPKAVQYSGLSFSPDGNYIYYTAFSQELAQTVLFQVPTLGGSPKKVLENVVTSPVSFSPDGKQFAFVRATTSEEFMLMIANADGTEERKIVQYEKETMSAPAWSPDGKRIAYRLGNAESNDSSVFTAEIADGATKQITKQRWLGIGGLTWLGDGGGLLMLATSGQQFVNQVWHLSYPNGEARQITNDLNNYLGMSLAADSNNLAVVQSQQQASISVAPTSDPNRLRPVTSGSGKADLALVWTPDGKIVYQSNAGGNNIWITDPDDPASARQLNANGYINLIPEVSPDGRSVVFLSYRTGVPHLWRMNIDGSDQKQLTNGTSGEAGARFSPDGRWLVYRRALGKWTLWKMPADGSGEPIQITDKYSRSAEFSPDGKLIAYFSREDNAPWRITVAPFEGSEPQKTFDIPALPTPALRWTPDGRAIAYVDTRNGVSNIVAQPLDGGKIKKLTDFTQERIFSFDYSRDGKLLALSRGTINNDVVLISNFK